MWEGTHAGPPSCGECSGWHGWRPATAAVFDGHGGVDAARYAAVHVHTNAAHQPELPTDPAGALKEAFRRTDEMFLWKAKRERLQSGTTGVCALITGTTLHVAWLGDSQVILVQQGQVVKLMEPHKPERQVKGSLCLSPGHFQTPIMLVSV